MAAKLRRSKPPKDSEIMDWAEGDQPRNWPGTRFPGVVELEVALTSINRVLTGGATGAGALQVCRAAMGDELDGVALAMRIATRASLAHSVGLSTLMNTNHLLAAVADANAGVTIDANDPDGMPPCVSRQALSLCRQNLAAFTSARQRMETRMVTAGMPQWWADRFTPAPTVHVGPRSLRMTSSADSMRVVECSREGVAITGKEAELVVIIGGDRTTIRPSEVSDDRIAIRYSDSACSPVLQSIMRALAAGRSVQVRCSAQARATDAGERATPVNVRITTMRTVTGYASGPFTFRQFIRVAFQFA